MRIAWLEPHYGICGGNRRWIEISNFWTKWGHDVYVFTPGVETCDWIPTNFTRKTFKELGKCGMFDVGLFNLETMYSIMHRLPAKTYVNYILHYAPLYKDAVEGRISYQRGYHQVANSGWTADFIELETGKRPVVVNGGLNHDNFKKWDVPREYSVLCYGSQRNWKGTKTIERACEILGIVPQTYDGKGILQEAMGREYSKADCFVSGSWVEGWCQPCIEAMACGTPLVTTSAGGNEDFCRDEYNCLMVKPHDAEQMANAIKRIREDKDLRDRLVENGLKTAKEYSWEKTAKKLLKTIKGWV